MYTRKAVPYGFLRLRYAIACEGEMRSWRNIAITPIMRFARVPNTEQRSHFVGFGVKRLRKTRESARESSGPENLGPV